MDKNYINRVLWLVIATIAVLLGAYFLPDMSIGDVELRRVDLLADLRDADPDSTSETEVALDSVVMKRKGEFVDSCKSGMTCIEDYSFDYRGMAPFYEALNHLPTLNRPVRIAVLGDSYIEGDILTADLRNLLQDRYGGCGVGFVTITSEIAGFRRSVIHHFGGWTARNSVGGGPYNRSHGIISGHYFHPDSAAWMSLTGQKKYCTRLDTCFRSSLYLIAPDSCRIKATINGGKKAREFRVAPSSEIQCLTVADTIHSIRWRPSLRGHNFIFYGATMEADRGIVLDNFSLRGSPGTNLGYVHDEMLRKFDRARHYDLVILVYGLNVATPKGVKYDHYRKDMTSAIDKMKECMPGTGFLLVSLGDRDERVDGQMRTMKGVKNLIKYQQAVAAESGIAFWNMYDAMGGEGSIAKMAADKEANLDYTHINFRGGKKLARLLFEAMEYGRERYERRKAYESGKEVGQ